MAISTKRIGQFICQLRKEKGLTQAALAEQLNLSNRAVSKWETGDGLPDVSVLPELADALDVTVDELLRGKRREPAVPEVRVTEVADRANLYNTYRVFFVIALFSAVFSALAGTLTQVYCIYAFKILFYTHWEILFDAAALFSGVLAALLYTVGLTRLSLGCEPGELHQSTRRRTRALILVLLPFPLSFLLRVVSVFLPLSYLWAEVIAAAVLASVVILIVFRVTKHDPSEA